MSIEITSPAEFVAQDRPEARPRILLSDDGAPSVELEVDRVELMKEFGGLLDGREDR